MATRLLLIAHGETSATRRAAFASGEGLEPRGLRAARLVAARRPLRPDAAWSSPAAAARETCEALGLAARSDDALRDLDVGRWAGRSFAEVADAEPERAAAWVADPTHASHGGEPIDALVRRVAGWLALRRADRGSTVAVTHAAVVRAAVLAALDAPHSAFWRIDVAPLALVEFGTDGRRWSLRAGAPRRALT